MTPPEQHSDQRHPPDNHLTKLLSLPSDIISDSLHYLTSFFPRLETAKKVDYDPAVPDGIRSPPAVNGNSILSKKLVAGFAGVAYMCLVLMTVMLVAVAVGVGLVRFWVEEPVSIEERLYFDYREAHPSAVLDFGLEEYDKVVRSVPVGHVCNVRLDFVMPESDYNREIGMFQVVAESLSLNGDPVASSSRPCMLRFWSQPVRLMRTFLMAMPLILGFKSEIQTVTVPLLKYKELYYHRTQFIKISLVPRAGTPFLPQIYEANLIVSSELPWVKRLVRNWKWTFSVWTSMYIYLFLVLLLISFFRSILFPTLTTVSDDQGAVEVDDTIEGRRPRVVVGARARPTSETLRQWRQSRSKRKAMVYDEDAMGSDATSMSVTRGEDTDAGATEEVGDSESVCR